MEIFLKKFVNSFFVDVWIIYNNFVICFKHVDIVISLELITTIIV